LAVPCQIAFVVEQPLGHKNYAQNLLVEINVHIQYRDSLDILFD